MPPTSPWRSPLAVGALAVACLIAIVAGALVVVVATRGGDDDASPTPAPKTTAPAATATTGPTGLSGELDIGAGVVAIVPQGSLSDDAELVAERRDPPELGRVATLIGDTVEVSLLRGHQRAPIELRLPYLPPSDAPSIDGKVPADAVFALREDGGESTLLPTTVDEGDGTATFATDSLSRFRLVTWSTAGLHELADEVVAGMAGVQAGITPLDCPGPSPETSAVGDGGAVDWCAVEDDDGGRTLWLANVSGHAVSVRWSEGVEAKADEIGPLASHLSRIEAATGDRVLVLGPGDTALFIVDGGVAATIEVTYDGAAHALTGLLTAAHVLDRVAAEAPWGGPAPAEGTTAAMGASECVAGLPAGMAVSAGAWRAALARCADRAHLTDVVDGDRAGPLAILLGQIAEEPDEAHADAVDGLQADSDLEVVIEG